MGRLPAVVLVLGIFGCNEEGASKPTPRSRTDVVSVKSQPKPQAVRSTTTTVAPKPARNLCVGQTPRDSPATIDTARAAGGAAPGKLAFGKRWVWVNVWAAWCEPCKKEMPMLIAWRDKLRRSGVDIELAFVSIDDDERELTRFLGKQPEGGMRTSYWLASEDERAPFFEALGYDDEPTLPVHAFVSPDSKVSCVGSGALETSDYASLRRHVSR